MIDLYLKATSQSALMKALELAGIVREIPQDERTSEWAVTDGHKYALDVIGAIWKETGETIETDNGPMAVTKPIDGFHANLRVMANDFDAETVADLVINAPRNPARGWA